MVKGDWWLGSGTRDRVSRVLIWSGTWARESWSTPHFGLRQAYWCDKLRGRENTPDYRSITVARMGNLARLSLYQRFAPQDGTFATSAQGRSYAHTPLFPTLLPSSAYISRSNSLPKFSRGHPKRREGPKRAPAKLVPLKKKSSQTV
jgi:hypothetical protein